MKYIYSQPKVKYLKTYIIQLIQMLYMFCPTCRELLADKQKYFERKMIEICQRNEMGEYKNKDEVDNDKQKLVNNLGLSRYCCKQRIMTYVRSVDIVK